MNKRVDMKKIYPLIAAIVAVLLGIVIFALFKEKAGQQKVSEFGKYQGYSEKIYDGNKRISDYLTLSNGTRLAYDLILPTKKGVPAGEPLPVLFKYTPYLRTFTIFDKKGNNIISDLYDFNWIEKAMLQIRYWISPERGRYMDPVFRTKWLENMLTHGYAVVVVERSGTGASFGSGDLSQEAAAREADQILNWIASQAWCNGNIGMYGDSFQAMVQFAAASTGNPHLKAIFPAAGSFDNYSAVSFAGGVYNKAFQSFFTWATSFLEHVITPVDSDKDGAVLAQARKERNSKTLGEKSIGFKNYPFRDSISPKGNNFWEDGSALYPFIGRINHAGIPAYMTTGWFDLFPGDNFLWYHNLTVPKRLAVRPLDHSGIEESQFDLDYAVEAQRWFDYWLKGINNGIMDEPPIHYYVMGAAKNEAWRTSNRWPPANQELTRFYFGKGKTGSAASINGGFLATPSPTATDAFDAYTVDYSTTSGKKSRWMAVNWSRNYPDMSVNDKKALSYTTSPLESDMEITGHPVVHLWLTTDAPDLDAFVYLEEVDRSGKSSYITEGNLRASHRRLSQAPYNNIGLPFHSHYQSDMLPIPAGEPVELVFSLLPTSYRFHKGSCIRITVAFADADNFATPVINPAPNLHLLRDTDHPSLIQLPVIQSR